MALTNLRNMGLDDEVLELPIGDETFVFRMPGARLGYALRKASTTGRMDRQILGDDRTADEYRLLLGEHYETLLSTLSTREWEHVTHTLVMWVLTDRETAERVWERLPELRASAGGGSSAEAPAKTASTSGTSTTTAARSGPRRKRRR